MNSKITIPIVIAISVIITAGIMFSIGYDNQPQITQTPQTEIIYVDKTVSEYFEGSNEIKKISSQEELQNILEASSSFDGGFDPRMLRSFAEDAVMFDTAESTGMPSPSVEPMPTDGASKVESGGTDYSTTNVQVANVDEPDYLKND